jgi:transcription-repair coupling factor (superfamily II helicase)
LGSGYGIALKDLEQRGAGNILGSAQSGWVHSVGFDTYMRLLEQTIRQIKGNGNAREYPTTEVSVDGIALIPDEYVADEAQKLHLYRRLATIDSVETMDTLRREIEDRFGKPIPMEAETLLDVQTLRILGTELGIERVLVRPWDARLNFRPGVVPRIAVLQRIFAERQFEVELVRPFPLSLVLHRRGTEPASATLIAALRSLTREHSLAA